MDDQASGEDERAGTPGRDAPPAFDHVDAALADALERDGAELVDIATLAERADLSRPLLEALAREGLLPARQPGLFAERDLAPVLSGLALLEAGLPLDEMLDLARDADAALQDIAADAVEMFLGFVRDPVRGTTDDPQDAADALVEAFRTMLPEAERLVGRRFGQLVLTTARTRVGLDPVATEPDTDGDAAAGARDADTDRV